LVTHPWSKITHRCLTEAEWYYFTAWLRSNPKGKTKQGTARGDGMVFVGYRKDRLGGEWWATPAVLDKYQNRRPGRVSRDPKAHAAKRRWRYATDPAFREALKQSASDFRKKRPDLAAADTARRRARVEKQIHPDLHRGVEQWHYSQAKKLTKATGILHQVDHIIPIAAGGWHHHLNMQVLPCNINHAKGGNPTWTSSDYLDFRFVPEWLWPERLVATYRSMMRGEHLGLRAG
jgi:hypothetical protein